MKRERLPKDVARALRDCMADVARASAEYDAYSGTHSSYESAARLDELSLEINFARARLTGVVQSILRQDEEAAR